MFEVFTEVRAVLSPQVIAAIEGSVLDVVRQYVFTAVIEQVIAENEIQYHLSGNLDGILVAKSKLEELLNGLHIKRIAKDSNNELDSTTFSEENSSLADESCDKDTTDKTSCLSDDKERETNASSNGYVSTNTESSVRTLRMKPLSKKLRFILKERPRVSQRTRSARLALQLRTLKKKSLVRTKFKRPLLRNDPDCLSENLQQMKLATEDSDIDSTGTEAKGKLPLRLPCKARNYEAVSTNKYSCNICSFKTKRSSHFLKHMTNHHEKVLNCKHCSYQTTKQRYFERHQRLHSTKRTPLHQCEQCAYKTHRKEHFIRHMNSVHADERPYLCHICGKSFKRGDALTQHQQMHSATFPFNNNYKCSVCDKLFRSQSHLCEHQAVHSELRSFLCEICGASFKTRSVHRKHVQSIHRNPRAFLCDLCGKKFNTQYTLKRHKKTHTAKPNCIVQDVSTSFLSQPSVSAIPSTSEISVEVAPALLSKLTVQDSEPVIPSHSQTTNVFLPNSSSLL